MHAVVSGQVRRSLCHRENIIGRHHIVQVWEITEFYTMTFIPEPVDLRFHAFAYPIVKSRTVKHFPEARSEEHTSELQSLLRISYAVFCLKKKKQHNIKQHTL